MSFIIMYNYATLIDMLQSRCHYIILYCHLLGIWYVFIVDMLFLPFFDPADGKIYVDIYLKIFRCILVLYTHQI